MNDALFTTLVIRGGLAAAFALVGAWCVFLGYRLLFRRSPVHSKSNFEAEFGKHRVTFSAGAAGTAVVFTSSLWLAGAVFTAPTLKQPDGTVVALGPTVENLTGLSGLATLTFKDDSVSLTPSQKKEIDTLLSRVSTPTPRIVIEGFANYGQREENLSVAERRAELVRSYIAIKHNISPSRINTVSYGEDSPLKQSKNKNEVVITVTSKGSGG